MDNKRNPTVIRVHLKRTKTAQYSGIDVYLGQDGYELCLVAALLAYIAVRGMSPGPLFQFQDSWFLIREQFISLMRADLDILCRNSKEYVGHSFRIGAATTAVEQGIDDSVIEMLGRWESLVYQLYIRTPESFS